MPPTFTTILAEHLARPAAGPPPRRRTASSSGRDRSISPPAGLHMRVTRRDGPVVALDDGPPVNFCKPAVDPCLPRRLPVWGDWNLALILTGMGSDGARGAAQIVAAGGASSRRTKRRAWSGACLERWRRRDFARRCCRSIRSRPKIVRLFFGGGRDGARLRIFCANFCEERSGFVLSADKQYLWKAGFCRWHAGGPRRPRRAGARLGNPNSRRLRREVVEAMTTDESFFFRDKIPFEHFRDIMIPELIAARGHGAGFASGARPPRPARSHIRSPCRSRKWAIAFPAGGSKSLRPTFPTRCCKRRRAGIYSQFEVQRGLPIALLLKYFTPDRRQLADRSQTSAPWCNSGRST